MRIRPSSSSRTDRERPKAASQPFADCIAKETLKSATTAISIDRSLAPPGGPARVQLPACRADCAHRALRPAAQLETTPETFHDLVPDEVISALPEAERLAILAPRLEQRARRHIDVALGAVSIIDPGFEDLSRVRCSSSLAWILYLLGPREGCACYAALVSAVPTDEPTGLFVHAKAAGQTAQQTEEAGVAAERHQEASAGRSAYFRTLFEQRRRPPVGDLFAAFDITLSDDRPDDLPILPRDTQPSSPPPKGPPMINPFQDGSVAIDLTDAGGASDVPALKSDDHGRSDEDRRSDREDDDKAAQIARSYGAVFAEVSYRDLPAWALQELSFG